MRTIITLSIILPLFIMSCHEEQESKAKPCCSGGTQTESLGELSGESVYNLTSEWRSQEDQALRLDEFRNKIVIAAMIFTHCESACPRIVADMKRIEAALTEVELQEVSFLLLSMDPERDTPAKLTAFAADHSLGPNWTLVSGSADATMEMANVLGVRVKKLEDGGFDHSNIIHVFDREGVISFQQNGFSVEIEGLVNSLRKML